MRTLKNKSGKAEHIDGAESTRDRHHENSKLGDRAVELQEEGHRIEANSNILGSLQLVCKNKFGLE